jgi:7-carboxy-7-deazaguanine synthase (Cx14CxxC type)
MSCGAEARLGGSERLRGAAMTYAVKEIFYTLQGEGRNAGRAAVFCRFSGCNLWSGRERDRAQAACTFCDTDFVGTDGSGGGKFADAEALADAVAGEWPKGAAARPLAVLTGGEPLLQLDAPLIAALRARSFEIAVETNGTLPAPDGIDWLCVSPKGNNALAITSGDELKLVYPQPGVDPAQFEHLDFAHFLLQPLDGPDPATTAQAVAFCLAHPKWRLSLQTHKQLGIR